MDCTEPQAESPAVATLPRRALLRAFTGGAASLAAVTLVGCGGNDNVSSGQTPVTSTGPTANGRGVARDIDILNFALHLEYLEAEFYTYATTGRGIETLGVATNGGNGIGGTATAGTTTGGTQVDFAGDTALQAIANELAADERAHVTYLRTAISQLGGTPIAKPALNINALGLPINTVTGFLTLSRAFEDVGVSAYGGAAAAIATDTVLQSASRILAAEGEHAGNIRLQIYQRNIQTTPVDALDTVPRPSGPNLYNVDANASSPTAGLAIVRTPRQVLNIVLQSSTAVAGGFFPGGLFANLPTLNSLS